MKEEKKVQVYQCVYCGIIKKFPDGTPCTGCGREYLYLKPIKINEKDWQKIRQKQKELERKASQLKDGWLELREYGEQLKKLLFPDKERKDIF